MVYVGIVGCITVCFLIWKKLKDIVAPPLIISLIWAVMYTALLLRGAVIDQNNINYLSFFIGLCFFVIGFFSVLKDRSNRNDDLEEKKSVLNCDTFLIKLALIIEIIIFLSFAFQVRRYISAHYVYNFWKTLISGKTTGTYNEGLVASYARNAVISFAIVCSIVYFSNPNKRNRNYFFITFVIALFFTVTAGNRGIILMLILAVFFSNLLIKRYSIKKSLVIMSFLTVIAFAVFISFAFLKYVYDDQSNVLAFILKQLRVYFTTSMVAFTDWMDLHYEPLYGKNTFRFLYAVLNRIGYDVDVAVNRQNYVLVYGDRTNVYTVLHYYAADFGLGYAFVIQFLLGIMYGLLYKKVVLRKSSNVFCIGLLSLMYFPLINQFFDDKYFSIMSTWLQLSFWLWLFTRKSFLIKQKE